MRCPLKTTPTGRRDARAVSVKGERTGRQFGKKKIMKTHTNPDSELKGLPVQSSKSVVGAGASGSSRNSSSDTRPRIDMAKRDTNRQLGTQALLVLLRTQAPALYDVAQIVGKWVWV